MRIKFYKGGPFTSYEPGAVYFDDTTKTIKIAKSDTDIDVYSGVRSAILKDGIVTFINESGESIPVTSDVSDFVTSEDFFSVQTAALGAIQTGTLGTINGESIENGNDITLDLDLYKIVKTLPTEDILTNKIYIVPVASTTNETEFAEYMWTGESWDQLGSHKTTIKLDDYLKSADADKKYVAKSTNTSASINTDKNGAMANFSDNGQAYLAVRPKTEKFLMNIPYAAAAFGVKDDGTAAFSHKQYSAYNKDTGAYSGAKNTAVLQFAGPVGLRYAKNTGTANDVTEAMYKYVGVIDSPDEFQRVYSATQVDALLKTMSDKIDALEARIAELENN